MSKIIPEQLPSLFEEIDSLKWSAYQEGMNPAPAAEKNYDYVEEVGMVNLDYGVGGLKAKEALDRLSEILNQSTVVTERNLDTIDVGTAFYGRWMDSEGHISEEPQRLIMVDRYISTDVDADYEFVSKNSVLGKAILGKTDGDVATYDVESKKYTFFIDSIDRDLNNYVQLGQSNGRAK